MVSKTAKLGVHHRKQFFCGYKAGGGRGEDSKLELGAGHPPIPSEGSRMETLAPSPHTTANSSRGFDPRTGCFWPIGEDFISTNGRPAFPVT